MHDELLISVVTALGVSAWMFYGVDLQGSFGEGGPGRTLPRIAFAPAGQNIVFIDSCGPKHFF